MKKETAHETKYQIQDRQYKFPYHYIPQRAGKNNVRQNVGLNWGIEYLSYVDLVKQLTLDIYQKNPGNILEVGCGDGRILSELKKSIPVGNLKGIDISSDAVAIAQFYNPGLDIQKRNILQENGKADNLIVLLIEVLEHIPTELNREFISAVRKNISEKGTLILTVPSTNIPVQRKHFQHYTSEKIKATLNGYFDILSIQYICSNSFVSESLKKAFFNRFFSVNWERLLYTYFRFYVKSFLHSTQKQGRKLLVIAEAAG